MAVANNALLGALLGTLIEQNVITRLQLMHAITTARRTVNSAKDSPAHASADVVLANLQNRFPVT
jgi:hypothetical protein